MIPLRMAQADRARGMQLNVYITQHVFDTFGGVAKHFPNLQGRETLPQNVATFHVRADLDQLAIGGNRHAAVGNVHRERALGGEQARCNECLSQAVLAGQSFIERRVQRAVDT
jgi:hypothetical protein